MFARFGLAAAFLAMGISQSTQETGANEATREIERLERTWDEAHVRGDVPALDRLCADELIVTVPEMPVMTKADVLGFWRTGRAKITRYETTDRQVRVYGEAAVVSGRLRRTRDFNGKVVDDDWRFTKTYVKQGGQWRVVAYHASVAAK